MRQATYWDEEKGADDEEKKGICSNFLCDTKPGDEVTMTGDIFNELGALAGLYDMQSWLSPLALRALQTK